MSRDRAQAPSEPQSTLEEIRATRLEKVEQLQQAGLTPYAYRWESTHHAAELQTKYVDLPNGEEAAVEVAIAGRIMVKRVFGKLAFFTLQDETGTIQLYLEKAGFRKRWQRRTKMPLTTWKQLTDPGDIIGVMGSIKRTEKANCRSMCGNTPC